MTGRLLPENRDLEIDLGDGVTRRIIQISAAMSVLDISHVAFALKDIIAKRGANDLIAVAQALKIATTPTFVDDPEAAKIIDGVAETFPFSNFLSRRAIERHFATRDDLLDYWQEFMRIARVRKFSLGQINGQDLDSLIPASRELAGKMLENSRSGMYAYMLAEHLNNAVVVAQMLVRIESPIALIEVIVGQRVEDLLRLEHFVAAFGCDATVENPLENMIITIGMCIRNSKK